jgi:hypothetical protein
MEAKYDMFNEYNHMPPQFGDSKLFQVSDDSTISFQTLNELEQRLFGYSRSNN